MLANVIDAILIILKQSRKRKREYDLLHDCQYDVTDLAEFKGSLLLNGFPSYFNHPTATSGGDENHVFEVFRVLVNLFRAHKKKCARSGKGPQHIVFY